VTKASGIRTASEWSQAILQDACAKIGVDSSGAELIKFTNNAVYSLSTTPIVVRIPGSEAIGSRVPKVVAVARWLASHNMPSVRLVDELPQPLHIGDHRITFWHRVTEASSHPADGHDLGRILRRFHALPTPQFDLPSWQPLNAIRARISQQDVLDDSDRQFLEETCDEISQRLTQIDYSLPWGPIHGDGFVGNLIPSPPGPIICDFDSACFGPREWDLTPVAVGKIRFDYSTDYHSQLAAEYGWNVLDWPYFPVFRQLRELQLVTSVLPVLNANPSLHHQWHHRFRTFRTGDLSAKWTTYR